MQFQAFQYSNLMFDMSNDICETLKSISIRCVKIQQLRLLLLYFILASFDFLTAHNLSSVTNGHSGHCGKRHNDCYVYSQVPPVPFHLHTFVRPACIYHFMFVCLAADQKKQKNDKNENENETKNHAKKGKRAVGDLCYSFHFVQYIFQ